MEGQEGRGVGERESGRGEVKSKRGGEAGEVGGERRRDRSVQIIICSSEWNRAC